MDPKLLYIVVAIILTAGLLWLGLRPRSLASGDDGPSMAKVKRHVREGNETQAIEEYRTLTGAEFDEAQAFVASLPKAGGR